jgi:hypothetical protein
MKSFRADSIVKDCEAIRQALTVDYPEDQKKWSIMGQSFGGFCSTTYLSFYPEGVKEAFLFGGLYVMSIYQLQVRQKLTSYTYVHLDHLCATIRTKCIEDCMNV